MKMSSEFYLILCFSITILAQQEDSSFGELIGDLSTLSHNVSGRVYVNDEHTIYITDFYYDGLGPDAHFLMGSSDAVTSSGATILADECSTNTPLSRYNGKNLAIALPSPITNFRWLSVWCLVASADFGHVMFPNPLVVPMGQVNLGQFSQLAHGVRSGTVTLLNERQIRIEDLHYDGYGPGAYFLVGNFPVKGTDKKIPDETGRVGVLNGYRGTTIVLTLPDLSDSFSNYEYLAIYCIPFTSNFGNVDLRLIGNGIVPPSLPPNDCAIIQNCEELFENRLKVVWEVRDDVIRYTLTGALDGENGYMAFGISGSNTSARMVDADVTVAFYDSNMFTGVAQDYFLSAKARCSEGNGACPDQGTDDVDYKSGFVQNGVTAITYEKKIDTGDSSGDKVIHMDKEMFMVWALGGLGSPDKVVTKHDYQGFKKIKFGRSPVDNCEGSVQSVIIEEDREPWHNRKIEKTKRFSAVIGPPGPNVHGYKAITGNQPWGIAWYINGELIPEIFVERGETYTFTVEGGDDDTNSARYHPFYITDDSIGGYVDKSRNEKRSVKVFAGMDYDGNPTGVGRYCEWQRRDASIDLYSLSDYRQFKDSLKKVCDDGEPGTVEWTPDENTPELVYYQCYTHNHLGWKIHVIDGGFQRQRGLTPLAIGMIVVGVILGVVILGVLIITYWLFSRSSRAPAPGRAAYGYGAPPPPYTPTQTGGNNFSNQQSLDTGGTKTSTLQSSSYSNEI